MSETISPTDLRGSARGRRLPLFAIMVVSLVGAFTLRDHLSLEALAQNREVLLAFRDTHFLLSVLVFFATYVVIVGFGLPGATVATLVGGYLFSTWPGVAFNVMAATIGATLIFTAARAGLGDRLAAGMDAGDGALHRIKLGIDENQWSVLFLIRLVPAVPFFVANLAPALFGVPTWRFFVTTFLGIIPGAIVYTSVGAGLGELFAAGGMPDPDALITPPVLLPMLGLCVLAAMPMIVKAARAIQT